MKLRDYCQQVKALIIDVDGVLTAGGITYAAGGGEIKQFHVRDGSAMKLWQQTGKPLAILSGRHSEVTTLRARELGIALLRQGSANKVPGYHQLLREMQLSSPDVAYIGDDLPDLPILRECGLGIAVADACPEAITTAHYVTRVSGGQGAVREAIELILRCQGYWPGTGN